MRSPTITLVIVCRSMVQRLPLIGYPVIAPSSLEGLLRDGAEGLETSIQEPFWRWTLYHAYEDRINIRIGFDNVDGPINGKWAELGVYTYRTGKRDLFRNGQLFYDHGGDRPVEYPSGGAGLFLGGFRGDLAEVLIFAGTLSDPERMALESELMRRWLPAP